MPTDKERLDAAANWIRNNQDKKGSPDWDAVTDVYKQLRGAELTTPEPPKNPFMGKPLDELKKAYAQHKFTGNKDLLPLIADAYVKSEYENAGTLGKIGLNVDDVIRQTAEGVPVIGGASDEANAKLSETMGGDYGESLDYNRARDRAAYEASPALTTALNVTGGIAGTLAGARALGVPALGVGVARPLAQTVLRSAPIGAAIGAADGFTRGEGGLENRLGSSLVGGGVGLLTGAAAPVIGEGLSAGLRNVANTLQRSASFAGTGMQPKVAEALSGLLEGDDALGQAVARIRQSGDDAMLVDAGPNAAGALDATIQVGGPNAVRVASQAVDQRATDAARRMTAATDQAFGAPQGVRAQRTAIREDAKPVLDPAYKAAYARPIDYASEKGAKLEALFKRIPGDAWGYANKLMKLDGVESKQIMATVGEDGGVSFKKMPDVMQLDYVKRALDASAMSGEGQGALGGQTAMGRAYQNLARELRGALGDAVKEYDVALKTAADPIRKSKAVELGARLLSPQYTRSELAEELKGVTGPEREAIRSGIRAQLDEAVANVKQMASDPNVDARELKRALENVTSRASREKVGMVLNNPNDAMRFYTEVGRAMRALELKAQVSTNSRTAGRQAMGQRMDEAFAPGPMGAAMQGELGNAGKQILQMMTGATRGQQRQAINEQWLTLARALTGPRGRDAEALFRRLVAANRARGANALAGQRLGILGAGTVAGSQPVASSRLRSN